LLLTLEPDQQLFADTTAKLLGELVPVQELRRLRDDPEGYDETYWRRGCELGWTSLLVSEARGGGSISGQGLVDLSLVAYEFGRRAAPGPLLATNVVASALSDTDRSDHQSVIDGLLSGTSMATWCFGEPRPNDGLSPASLEIAVEGDELIVNGTKQPVESGGGADHFLVSGRTGTGRTQVLVPADAAGVSVTPMRSTDMTRRFSALRFDDVRVPLAAAVGDVEKAGEQIERQLVIALAILTAEAVGTMQAVFDMTVEWAFDRYSFGRPLASYQELKHRFADMKSWLEASHAISDGAVEAAACGSPDANELLAAAKAFIGDYGSELMHDCVQMHGGIGVTFEHDLHLYLRRHTLNRTLFGTPAEHRRRLADDVARQQVPA
jgi:alkylation response protein AidB-like acyl-CoA dehydrogenase